MLPCDFSYFYKRVEGWCNPYIIKNVIGMIDNFQLSNSVVGHVMEIGVHNGKFFIPLHNLLRDSERSFAVDLFGMQQFNMDGSGCGKLEQFNANMDEFSVNKEKCSVISQDSIVWNYNQINEVIRESQHGMRIISIDGSHTLDATVIDLINCEKILEAGGVIFLDDYFSINWPGVSCGLSKFFLLHHPKIAPFFVGLNKLILCHVSWHKLFIDYFNKKTAASKFRRLVEIHGYPVFSFSGW